MSENDDLEKTKDIFQDFSNAVAEIFNDPSLKKKTLEFRQISIGPKEDSVERLYSKDLKERIEELEKFVQEFNQRLPKTFKEKTEEPLVKEIDFKEVTAKEDPEKIYFAQENVNEIAKKNKKNEKQENIPEQKKNISDDQKNQIKDKTISRNHSNSRAGRIVGYSVAIFWNVILIVFFNFYSEYIAVYISGGIIPILTADWKGFLPIMTMTLTVSIIGNITMIINDRFELKQMIEIILIVLGIATVVTLLYIFPFDFNSVPNAALSIALRPIITIVLVVFSVMLGIGALIRFIRYIVLISKSYQN